MATDDFFRARLDAMIELKQPLAVLSTRLPSSAIETAVAPKLSRRALPAKRVRGEDLLGAYDAEFGGGVSPAGRLRLPIRLSQGRPIRSLQGDGWGPFRKTEWRRAGSLGRLQRTNPARHP